MYDREWAFFYTVHYSSRNISFGQILHLRMYDREWAFFYTVHYSSRNISFGQILHLRMYDREWAFFFYTVHYSSRNISFGQILHLRMYDREWALFALSFLLCLNYPGDIVITINNLAMIIIFNALWKLLPQKSQTGIPLILSIENVNKKFWKWNDECSRWGYMTDEHRNAITLSAMEGWKISQVDNKKPEELSLTILMWLIRIQLRFSRGVTSWI